jgi:hypothetical protein
LSISSSATAAVSHSGCFWPPFALMLAGNIVSPLPIPTTRDLNFGGPYRNFRDHCEWNMFPIGALFSSASSAKQSAIVSNFSEHYWNFWEKNGIVWFGMTFWIWNKIIANSEAEEIGLKTGKTHIKLIVSISSEFWFEKQNQWKGFKKVWRSQTIFNRKSGLMSARFGN